MLHIIMKFEIFMRWPLVFNFRHEFHGLVPVFLHFLLGNVLWLGAVFLAGDGLGVASPGAVAVVVGLQGIVGIEPLEPVVTCSLKKVLMQNKYQNNYYY